MLNTKDPLVQIKITESVCAFAAISSTLYRLWVRRGRLWIDDAWATFALLTLFAQIGSVFMHVENPEVISETSRVAAYYLMAITFYAVIWASRISIIYSIIRLDPSPARRKFYVLISIVYFITVVVLIVQLFWVCEPEPSWKNAASPQCTLSKQVPIVQLVTDILADLFLLFAPLRVFMYLSDKRLRRKLVIIFSTCIITTIVSLVHAAYILTGGGIKELISALVEDCVSLMVANVPVVVTALLRFGAEDDERPPATRSMLSTAMHFASRKLRMTKATSDFSTTVDGDYASKVGSATLNNGGAFSLFSHGQVGTRGATTTEGATDPIMLDLMDGSQKTTMKGNSREYDEPEILKSKSGWVGGDTNRAV